LILHDAGLIEYSAALTLQEKILDEVISDTAKETLIVCEHPTVITVGRAPGSKEEVFTSSIPTFEVSRGGRATLHTVGQIVVYPIVDLKKRGKDLHGFLRILEEVIIDTLQDFRIQAARIEGKTGVWVGEHKIASLGIAVKKWVSYHGLALNVNCDLKLFSNISPCGFAADVMTSVDKELNDEYRRVWKLDEKSLMKNVRKRLLENLQEKLSC
jgi:lipoyl(octanoyl) transferase